MKIVEIHLPEYDLNKKPDYLKLGKKVDKAIENNFPNGTYILRSIGSDDHPDYNLDQLADIVLKTGTDKYDPNRKAVCHDEFCGYDYDIQAGTMFIKNGKIELIDEPCPTMFGSVMYLYYEHAPLDRGYSVRIDLLLIYDPKKVIKAKKFHPKAKGVRKGLNNYLYKFKDPEHKDEALIGIVKILR